MHLQEALAVMADKHLPSPEELRHAYREIGESVLAAHVARGRLDNSAAISTKEALNAELNRKASTLVAEYQRVLKSTDIDDFTSLEKSVSDQFSHIMKVCLSEADGRLTDIRSRLHATAVVGLNEDFGRLMRNSLADIKVLVAEIKREAMKQKHSTITYHLSGDNARVNINSTDYSINVANSKIIFDEVRKIAATLPDAELKAKALAKIDEMEQHAGKPSYLPRYSEFIALIANHAQLFAALIPALTQFFSA